MKVQIRLAALTRMEYTKEIEVPDDTPDHVLDQKLKEIYDKTDGDKYLEDFDYWERGLCHWEKV